jgi:prepilin signal peptidase PulO-like enzyme (type II secretory pathway)
VWFSEHTLVLTVAQASCIAIAAAGLPAWAERFRGSAWVLVLPLSIVVVIGAIAAVPDTARALTWTALILVPIGCALGLGWAIRGARAWLAPLAAPLLAIAIANPDSRTGQLAIIALIAGSAVTAGRLLVGVAPIELVKVGVIVMAVVDSILVFSGNLQHPNDVLVAAAPGHGLPQLQSASYAGAGMGYGDFFAAAVVGAVLAAEHRPRLVFAAVMVLAALAWDQLFLVDDVLPATVPPALTLIVAELAFLPRRFRSRRTEPVLP